MSKVAAGFTMSLDGYITGPDEDFSRLFRWYRSGDTDFPVVGTDMMFKVSRASADLLNEMYSSYGAILTGRRDFDVSNAWGGKAILNLPMFIVTHNPPSEWVYPGSPFTFVTDGVESALRQAQQAAGDKDVNIGGTSIVRQLLALNLLDVIHIDLVPFLIGGGIRLFDNLENAPIELENTRVVSGTGVTHLTFRVIKQ